MSASLQPQLVTVVAAFRVPAIGLTSLARRQAKERLEARLVAAKLPPRRLEATLVRPLRGAKEAAELGLTAEWEAWDRARNQPAEDPAQRQLFKEPNS